MTENLKARALASPRVQMPLVKKSIKIREDQAEAVDKDESYNLSGAVREMLDREGYNEDTDE